MSKFLNRVDTWRRKLGDYDDYRDTTHKLFIPNLCLGNRYLLYFFSAEETILKTVSTLEEAEKELDTLCRKYDELNVFYKGGTFEQVSSSERNL